MSENASLEQTLSTNRKEEQWEEKKLAALLEAASIAIKRARYVFILVNIVAGIIFSSEFNALFAWIRNSMGRATKYPEIGKFLAEVRVKELQVVSVPLLGIKFSVFDLSVLGALASLLLAIWFYYCVRREYLVVNEIYKIAEVSPYVQKRAYLYHGIAHYFVYTTATKRERPEGSTTQTTARAVVKILFFVPAWLPLLIVLSDIISLILPSEVTDEAGCTTLWCVLGRHGYQLAEAIIRMAFAVIVSLFSLSQCLGAYTWDSATRERVEKLQKQVERDTKLQEKQTSNP
jgi:hypothetical protein